MPSQYVEVRWNSYADRVRGAAPDYHVPKHLGILDAGEVSPDTYPRAECPCRGCAPTDNQ